MSIRDLRNAIIGDIMDLLQSIDWGYTEEVLDDMEEEKDLTEKSLKDEIYRKAYDALKSIDLFGLLHDNLLETVLYHYLE